MDQYQRDRVQLSHSLPQVISTVLGHAVLRLQLPRPACDTLRTESRRPYGTSSGRLMSNIVFPDPTRMTSEV